MARATRADRQAQTRERLLVAAHAVFLRRGFHAATLDDIAGEAGVTKGAIYSNFESKADLFLAVYDARLNRRLRRFARSRSGPGGLEDLAREHARLHAADDPDGRWTSVVVEAFAAAASDRALRAAVLERGDRANNVIAGIVRAVGARAGVDFAYPPAEIARVAGAVLRGLLLQRLLDPARMPTELLAGAFAAFVRGMVRPRPGRSLGQEA